MLFSSDTSLPLVQAIRANVIAIVYPAGHVWFGVRVDSEGRGRGKGEIFPPILTPLLICDRQSPP